jgi:hypothetical protein
MPLEIPNYDSIVGRAARPVAEDAIPAQTSLDSGWDWDPNQVELDIDELEACLSRR